MTAENPTGRSGDAETATVVNMKHSPELRAALDGADEHGDVVRIDRRTRWGNPFLIGRHGNREEVIERYRTWLWGKVRKGEIQVAELAALNGKTLACHCAPLPCHGDVLVKAAAWAQARIAPGKALTAWEGRTRTPVYAGVGARRTPPVVLASMRDMARELAARGWHLRTGGGDRGRQRLRPCGARGTADGVHPLAGLQRLGRVREPGARRGRAPRHAQGGGNPPSRMGALLPECAGSSRAQRRRAARRRPGPAGRRRGLLDRQGTDLGWDRHGDSPRAAPRGPGAQPRRNRSARSDAQAGGHRRLRGGLALPPERSAEERALPDRSAEPDGSGERRSQETASRPRLRHEARSRGRGLSM